MKRRPTFMLTRKVKMPLQDKAPQVLMPRETGASPLPEASPVTTPRFLLEEQLIANAFTHNQELLGTFNRLDDRFKQSLVDSFVNARAPSGRRQVKQKARRSVLRPNLSSPICHAVTRSCGLACSTWAYG